MLGWGGQIEKVTMTFCYDISRMMELRERQSNHATLQKVHGTIDSPKALNR